MYKVMALILLVIGLLVFKWLYQLPVSGHNVFTVFIPIVMVGLVGLLVWYLYWGQYLGIDK